MKLTNTGQVLIISLQIEFEDRLVLGRFVCIGFPKAVVPIKVLQSVNSTMELVDT